MRSLISAVSRRLQKSLLGPLPDDPRNHGTLRSPLSVSLAGRVVLVTGAAGELGRPIVRTLAACGARVAIHYHTSADKAEELFADVNEMGVPCCLVKGDICDLEIVRDIRTTIEGKLGYVDIVVNNAMAPFRQAPVNELTPAEFEHVYRTAVLQLWTTTKVFSGSMQARQWGRIIAMGTEVTSQALANYAAYTAAKCAMDGMMRSLARELGQHGITVNQVAPGWMISDRDRQNRSEVHIGYESGVPLKRRGYDQDVANLVAFLASDLASFITGVRIPVCGGNIMVEA